MTTIVLTELSNWTELSDSERWHAGYIARKLNDSGLVKEWRPGCVHQILYDTPVIDRPTRITRFAYDSLLCALTHAEKKYAFRAYVQAAEYIAQLKQMAHDRVIAYAPRELSDALQVARVRVEAMLLD